MDGGVIAVRRLGKNVQRKLRIVQMYGLQDSKFFPSYQRIVKHRDTDGKAIAYKYIEGRSGVTLHEFRPRLAITGYRMKDS